MYTSYNNTGRFPRRTAGFSLVELMVTLSISAVILSIAAPSFNELMARSRMTDVSRDLSDRIAIAMNTSESRPTTICVSTNGTTCSASANWHQGYIVFTDDGAIGTIDGSDEVLERAMPATGGVTITSSMEIGGEAYSTGRIHFVERAPQADGALRFTVCKSEREPRLVIVNRIGSMRQSKGTTTCA